MKIILFHSFKHHFGCNLEWLQQNKGQWSNDFTLLLKSIGTSQLDYYLGSLTVSRIEEEVFDYLNQNDLTEKEKYAEWLNENNGFREIALSDKSQWTLRVVDHAEYVHLHPARYSPDTIRVKANTLKTILCNLLLENSLRYDIQRMNHYRTHYLDLSPMALQGKHTEIENIFNLFINHLK